jgi:hypothetical protein
VNNIFSLFNSFHTLLFLFISLFITRHCYIWECNQKVPDWSPGARTANGTVLCHQAQLYRYFMSQSSEFCRHNPLCCFSMNVYCCKRIFRYRLSAETFGYTLVHLLRAWRSDDRGSIPGGRWEFLSSTPCPDRLWRSTSLLSNGYRGFYPGGKAAGTWSWPLTSI